MILLKDWNETIKYANSVCEDLKNDGYNMRLKVYSVYDGRKGLYLQVLDDCGKIFREYSTGTHDNLNDMKNSINIMKTRIIVEC